MTALEGKTLMAFIAENDTWHGKPLHAAILAKLLELGIDGATVLRGVEGYGAHHKIHTASVLSLSERLPLVIVAVDTVEKIDQAVTAVEEMVSSGLLVVQPAQMIRISPADPKKA